jgi:hypothetical protein
LKVWARPALGRTGLYSFAFPRITSGYGAQAPSDKQQAKAGFTPSGHSIDLDRACSVDSVGGLSTIGTVGSSYFSEIEKVLLEQGRSGRRRQVAAS